MKKISVIAGVIAAILTAESYAAGTFGTFGTATPGLSSGAGVSGSVTFVGGAPVWHSAYNSSAITNGAVTESAVNTTAKTITVMVPSSGSGASGFHWIYALRTTVGATDQTFGTNAGVAVDVMNGVNPAVVTRAANATYGGTDFTVTLPVSLTGAGATPAGAATALVPMYSAALRTFGPRSGTTLSQEVCFGGTGTSIISGNMIGTSTTDTAGSAAQVATARTEHAAGGGRNAAAAVTAFKAAGGSATGNTAATATAMTTAGSCVKGTSMTTASLFDYGLAVRGNNNIVITTANALAGDVSWTINMNVRLTFV